MASADFKASLSQVSGGKGGFAPGIWTATTEDDLPTITASGYVTDLVDEGVLGKQDWLFVSYTATDPNVAAPSAIFRVNQVLAVFSLVERVPFV